ncbi:MAG TPA: PIN domain-containing protein [Gammaproteobacteria bacterium]|nr:PIN domain-containing protein [Gammaproteobacteria bacterium]
MKNCLKETFVYVDTETFVNIKFDLKNVNLRHLIELKRKNFIKLLLITDITYREINRKFDVFVNEYIEKLLLEDKIPCILRNSSLFIMSVSLEEKYNIKNKIIKEFQKDLDKFIKDNFQIIPCYEYAEEVFNDYFNFAKPFEGPKTKKTEFPDAFVAKALKNFLKVNPGRVIFISSDNVFKETCDEIPELKSFSKLIEGIDFIYQEYAGEQYAILQKYIFANKQSLANEIKKRIEHVDFFLFESEFPSSYYYDFYKIINSKLLKVNILDSNITDLNEQDSYLEVEVRCFFKVDIDLSSNQIDSISVSKNYSYFIKIKLSLNVLNDNKNLENLEVLSKDEEFKKIVFCTEEIETILQDKAKSSFSPVSFGSSIKISDPFEEREIKERENARTILSKIKANQDLIDEKGG